ncbi:protein-disulfide reductase DsbD family protein [Rufibacter roseus]|uniref:Cytochrome c biogenesis protein CcdA n=1 Tax=Rufibacter roseus TaxID=1567108 RepID=A0ABW2DIQ9_9BACT|nr:thioredoxin family protein [Rufibacter roseus]
MNNKFWNRTWLLLLPLFFLLITAQGQILKPATWSYEASAKEVKVGEEVELIFNVKIIPNWYLYSSDFDPDLGPIVTSFTFQKHPSYALVGKIKPVNPKKKYDDLWGGEYTYFTKTAQFRQRVKVLQQNLVVKGSYEYQVCSEVTGQCIPGEGDFSFNQINVLPGAAPAATTPASEKNAPANTPAAATGKIDNNAPAQANAQQPSLGSTTVSKPDPLLTTQQPVASAPVDTATQLADKTGEQVPTEAGVTEPSDNISPINTGTVADNGTAGVVPSESLWAFFLLAFMFGLSALVTPCVFPMIPMTVSFFTNSSTTRGQAIFKALVYGFSIIAIYTVIGVIFARIFGASEINYYLSTHWLPNVLFFLVFLVFGMSFLGLFEITLPHSLVNKIDAQADKGGLYGVFFMAFTLAVVSFSCTGPIVGTVLIASAGGEILKPVVGMFGFSLAFALPFTLFAIFPNLLNSLPKSGGWLNSVKVVLGFLELALALKFLSIADQVYHWGILDREVYLALWIAIFSLMGLYLLGKLKFSHDSDLPYLGVPRLMLAIVTFSFVVYLVPGMIGAPLKALSGYLPPQATHDFDLSALLREGGENEICETPKYGDILHLPHGLNGYFDLEQAKRCAEKQNKPIFIDFTGHGCVNCREMEANVWSHPEVLKRLREEFVIVALYVDDKTELAQNEWVTSTYDGKLKNTIGKKNADYQITKFNANAQPYYVIMDEEGNKLVQEPIAYEPNVQKFIQYLDKGIAAYKAHNQAE